MIEDLGRPRFPIDRAHCHARSVKATAGQIAFRDRVMRQRAFDLGGIVGEIDRAADRGRDHAWPGPMEQAVRPDIPVMRGETERDAIATLQVSADVAGGDVTVRPDDEVLRRWWKQARARSHPDRRGGDRTEWDEVEQAAQTLNLS